METGNVSNTQKPEKRAEHSLKHSSSFLNFYKLFLNAFLALQTCNTVVCKYTEANIITLNNQHLDRVLN